MNNDKVGLVFAGGGGKGAYQVGFWKVLRELGIDSNISCISGTSVGALNAALFSQGDYLLAEDIWLNIKDDVVLNTNDNKQTINLNDVFKGEMGLFSKTGIRKMIIEHVKFNQLRIPTYATVTLVDSDNPELFGLQAALNSLLGQKIGKVEYKKLNDLNYEEALKVLLASSAIPMIYPGEKINNKLYFDGGLVDNVPIEPIYNNEKCNIIIVVYLSSSKIIEQNNYPNAKIIEIYPSQHLGGMLDFSSNDTLSRFEQGYNDTKRILEPMINLFKHDKVLKTIK